MREEKGFTLIELMVSVAVIAVLAAIAVPSYRYVVNSGQVSSDMNSLVGALQFARAEALKRGLAVVVCASTNSTAKNAGGAPAPGCSNANTWQTGWFTYVDADGSGVFGSGDEVIGIQAALASANTFVASNNTSSIRFNRQGFIAGLSAPVLVTLTPPGTGVASQKRCLAVGSVGRLTVQKPGEGSCT